ncbi:HAD family hydrolase [Brevibacterium luteolum]|uniref:HAD family hydrolase n=1 Tax=Brevibacterium luteolum TaxID=199591 RepID=UPI00223C35E7|nr:HAD family hydrolase [Brevibacterium luteolum]MCT1656265.1 HAD family hydrolase [Brevibacterium luteolum]
MRLTCRAILFDIDGTLVDSTASVERTWRTWAGEQGIDADAILRTSHGRRSQDVLIEHIDADQVEAAMRRLNELEVSDTDGVIALPGTRDILTSLPAGSWAAVTSGERHVMVPRLKITGLPVPEVLVTSEDVENGKPDPEGYLAAARQLGVDPAQCLVIEDAPAGIRAGLAAGAHVLGVATSHAIDKLTDAHARVLDLTACRFTPADEGIVVEITD